MLDNNHIIYTAEDIHRYFSGSMPADEMYAMDKAALNDPLLAEAMEGYHSLPSFAKEEGYADIQKQLDELKNRLPGKVVSIKKYNNNWWKVAAAVLLIGGSVFAFFKLTSSKTTDENTIAKTDSLFKHQLLNDSGTFAKNDSVKKPVSLNNVAEQQNQLPEAQRKIVNSSPAVGNTAEKTITASASDNNKYQWQDDIKGNLASKQLNNGFTYSAADSSQDVAMTERNMNMKKTESNINQDFYTTTDEDQKDKTKKESSKRAWRQLTAPNFKGRITDANNNAIPYANLMINNSKQAKTDANGFFNMALPDTSIRLDIAVSDYYPQTANLTANNFAGIILKAKRTTFRKRAIVADSMVMRSKVDILYKLGAEPKEGWIAYQQFLVQQCSNSEYDNGKTVTGETIVQFEIDANGLPTNFHFEKSIDQDVNDGVENLIINGPEWNYTEHSAIPGIVRIKINF